MASVLDFVSGDDRLAILSTMLRSAGLEDLLESDRSITLLAPTDAGLQRQDHKILEGSGRQPDLVRTVLLHHLLPGRYALGDMILSGQVETVQGDRLQVRVREDAVTLNGTLVLVADIEAANGIIHLVDGLVTMCGNLA